MYIFSNKKIVSENKKQCNFEFIYKISIAMITIIINNVWHDHEYIWYMTLVHSIWDFSTTKWDFLVKVSPVQQPILWWYGLLILVCIILTSQPVSLHSWRVNGGSGQNILDRLVLSPLTKSKTQTLTKLNVQGLNPS